MDTRISLVSEKRDGPQGWEGTAYEAIPFF